jgi:hypothetical protein
MERLSQWRGKGARRPRLAEALDPQPAAVASPHAAE